MGIGGGDQERAEITVSYLHHNMNDSAEKNNYLHFGNNYTYTIEITLARYLATSSSDKEAVEMRLVSHTPPHFLQIFDFQIFDFYFALARRQLIVVTCNFFQRGFVVVGCGVQALL
jgi:hypothetical protein